VLQGDAHGNELGCILRTPSLVAAHVAGGTGVDQDGCRQQGCCKGSLDQREQATRPRRASGHGDLLSSFRRGWLEVRSSDSSSSIHPSAPSEGLRASPCPARLPARRPSVTTEVSYA